MFIVGGPSPTASADRRRDFARDPGRIFRPVAERRGARQHRVLSAERAAYADTMPTAASAAIMLVRIVDPLRDGKMY